MPLKPSKVFLYNLPSTVKDELKDGYSRSDMFLKIRVSNTQTRPFQNYNVTCLQTKNLTTGVSRCFSSGSGILP